MTQPPKPGSRRAQNAAIIKKYLSKHTKGVLGGYKGLAAVVGLTVQQTARAVDDLALHDTTVIVTAPGPRTGYKVLLGWNTEQHRNEATQQRHLATREHTSSIRLGKAAASANSIAEAIMLQQIADYDAHMAADREAFIEKLVVGNGVV